jgi:hypothetical protein
MNCQIERFRWIGACNLIHNCAALRFEIVNPHLSIMPIDKRSGSSNSGQPFANLLSNLARTLGGGKLQTETPLHRGVARRPDLCRSAWSLWADQDGTALRKYEASA